MHLCKAPCEERKKGLPLLVSAVGQMGQWWILMEKHKIRLFVGASPVAQR